VARAFCLETSKNPNQPLGAEVMSQIILYTTEDGKTQIDLHLKDGTVWLSQQQIADLFQTSKQNISKHVKAIYADQELDEQATVNQQLTVQKEGSREVSRILTLYNLDMILNSTGRKLLDNAGTISSSQAQEKAKRELQRYKAITLDQVEKDYLATIASLEKQAKKATRKRGHKHE